MMVEYGSEDLHGEVWDLFNIEHCNREPISIYCNKNVCKMYAKTGKTLKDLNKIGSPEIVTKDKNLDVLLWVTESPNISNWHWITKLVMVLY